MAKNKQDYEIIITKYLKKPTGERYPDNAKPSFLAGKRKYGKAVKQSELVSKITWGTLRQSAYEKSKNKEVSVRWGKPRLISTTKELSNGDKEIIYYNPKRQR